MDRTPGRARWDAAADELAKRAPTLERWSKDDWATLFGLLSAPEHVQSLNITNYRHQVLRAAYGDNPVAQARGAARMILQKSRAPEPVTDAREAERIIQSFVDNNPKPSQQDWNNLFRLLKSEHLPEGLTVSGKQYRAVANLWIDGGNPSSLAAGAEVVTQLILSQRPAITFRDAWDNLLQTLNATPIKDWATADWQDVHMLTAAPPMVTRFQEAEELSRIALKGASGLPGMLSDADIKRVGIQIGKALMDQHMESAPPILSNTDWRATARSISHKPSVEWSSDDWNTAYRIRFSDHRHNLPIGHRDAEILITQAHGEYHPGSFGLARRIRGAAGMPLDPPMSISQLAQQLGMIAGHPQTSSEYLMDLQRTLELIKEALRGSLPPGSPALAHEILADVDTALQNNIVRLLGVIDDGYGRFPDWAELAGAAVDLELLAILVSKGS